jgi:pimeloyl-ACP methyl ester carboxylesterase
MSQRTAMLRLIPMLLLLAACESYDVVGPDRPGTWQPIGANNSNLQAMVADPSHLDRGVGASTDRGHAGSDAVQRLLEDRRRALPITRTTTVGGSGGGGGGGSR